MPINIQTTRAVNSDTIEYKLIYQDRYVIVTIPTTVSASHKYKDKRYAADIIDQAKKDLISHLTPLEQLLSDLEWGYVYE